MKATSIEVDIKVCESKKNEAFKKMSYIKDLENELFDLIKQERQNLVYNSFLADKISSLQIQYSIAKT